MQLSALITKLELPRTIISIRGKIDEEIIQNVVCPTPNNYMIRIRKTPVVSGIDKL